MLRISTVLTLYFSFPVLPLVVTGVHITSQHVLFAVKRETGWKTIKSFDPNNVYQIAKGFPPNRADTETPGSDVLISYSRPQTLFLFRSSPVRAPLRNSKESSFHKSQHAFVPQHSWGRVSKPPLVETR